MRFGTGQTYRGQAEPWHSRISWVMVILVICVIMFLWLIVDPDTISPLAMWPDYPMPWMFVTSIFMHASVDHIFWNMFMLLMFGITLERIIGGGRFMLLFVAAGVVGNVGYVTYCILTGSSAPAVGASGALYGIFACLAVLRPDIRVYLFFMIPLRIVHALMLYAAVDILFMNSGDNIAHAAHLAGLAAGLAYGLYLKQRLAPPETVTYRYSFDHY